MALGIALTPALAQQPEKPAAPRPPHPAWGGRDEAMNKRLKLTEAQKKAIEAIRAKHAEGLKAKFEGAASAEKALHEAMEKSDSTTDQLRSLHKAAADAQFEVLLAHRALRQEIRAQLTPEQREQAARLEGFRMGRMDRRGHGAGPGDPGFDFTEHRGHRGPDVPPPPPPDATEKAPAKPDAH